MTFIIGRDFAERQILKKKWKWPYLLNWVEYFDRLLRKHWYYQDLAQENANWHFISVETLPSSKFWKMTLSLELWRILWWNFATHWYWQDVANEVAKWYFGIGRGFAEVQILKKLNWPYPSNRLVYFDKILHTHYYWHDLDRGIAKSSPRDCKMTSVEAVPSFKFWKKWKWPNWVDYCDETLHTHWYWQDVAQEIVKCHLGLAEALPRLKFWKTVKLSLSLKTFWIFW